MSMRDEFSANDDEDGANFEFEDDSAFRGHYLRRVWRAIWRTLPVFLLTALLLVVAGQPNLALLVHGSPKDGPVSVTVVCDVPWAVIRVDGRGAATHCARGVAGALPMARVSVSAGQHTLIATAEGFAPYSIYVVAHAGTAGLYLTQFAPTHAGAAQALDAVNSVFASAYAQDVTLPATLWQALGLPAAPPGPSLVVRERFEAVALDSYEPFFTETTYQRPIAPDSGMVGGAVVVVEHVTIYDSCDTAPLLERRMPVLYATRASVTFSLRPATRGWIATSPYALNPTADIYTAPEIAATPATPAYVLALTARTALANWLGNRSLLAGVIDNMPLTSASAWAAGVILTLPSGARQSPQISDDQPGAVWLYIGGILLALTSAAHTLSPGAPTPAISLANLRASLAHPPARICGGA
jgi:hypothetical protein